MKLRELRQAKGISLKELADLTNIPYRTLQDIESGHIEKTKYENLYLVADALGCKVEDIVNLPTYTITIHETNKGEEEIFSSTSRANSIHAFVKFYENKDLNGASFKRFVLYKDGIELARFQMEQIADKVEVKHSHNSQYISYDPIYNYTHKKPF